MRDAEKFDVVKAGLKFCPECATVLDAHANNVNVVSCFLHGDFLLIWVEGTLVVQWRSMRIARFHIQEAVKTGLSAVAQKEIGQKYVRGEINFADACRMVAVAEGRGYSTREPTAEETHAVSEMLQAEMIRHMEAIRSDKRAEKPESGDNER
jgi:hypothetical protein